MPKLSRDMYQQVDFLPGILFRAVLQTILGMDMTVR